LFCSFFITIIAKENTNMLDIAALRADAQGIKDKLAKKNFKQLELVDRVLELDEQRRHTQKESDDTAAASNAKSKEIGKLMAEGKRDEAEVLKAEVSASKARAKELLEKLSVLEQQQYDLLIHLPNTPTAIVPAGITPEDNEVVRSGGTVPDLHDTAIPHWDICAKHNLIDFELGNKIAGSGFPVYVNQGAKLQRALINYFLDHNMNAGYIEYQPPYVANVDTMHGTGQLPDKEGQMYHVTADELYLIPTAEVPLTNIYRDVLLSEAQLPIKMTGYTPCFRREAGSYGKDVRGLNRLHQFDKVEIVQIVPPTNSYDVLDAMVAHVEALVASLEMPYRILRLCGGDMSFASALTYDFEVYSTAQQRWLEVSSVSNFETFQTNRMKCRYKDADGKIHLAHSLNGSSLALPRIVAALLENHQQADGTIALPKVLWPYFGKEKIG
jgi:seryl-tRNA synthetase